MKKTTLPNRTRRRSQPARCFATTGALLLVTSTKPALAAFEYRVSATGSVTYTDNINNAPDDVPEDSDAALRGKEAGFLFALDPGAAISLVEPRGQLTLGYSHPMTYATSDAVLPSSSDALIGAANYEFSNKDNAGLSLAVTRSSMTSFLFNGRNPAGVTGINNSGTEEIVRAQINEFWTHEWSEVWSTQQTSSYGTQLNFDDGDLPNTRIVTNALTLSLDHRFGVFTLAASGTSTELADGENSWTHLVTGMLGWSYAIDPLTTIALQVGVAKTLNDTQPQIIGGASIAQSRDFTNWSLSVTRSQAGDLQTGRVFTTESALGAITATPFETTEVGFTAGAGASRFEAEGATAYTAQAFASVSYAHKYFVSSLNYTFLRQLSEGDSLSAIPSLTRNAVTLTVGGVFPPQ